MREGKRLDEERERLAKVPGTKEHQDVLDNYAMLRKIFPKKRLLDKFKKYLSKNEMK
jgi:hypothetical protein